MHDLLNVLRKDPECVLTGRYYGKRLPSYSGNEHTTIEYAIVNPSEWHYSKILGNLINIDGATVTIRTVDDLDYNNEDFIVLQDGKTYQIISCTQDISATPQQVFRLLRVPVFISYILRLQEIDNPWSD